MTGLADNDGQFRPDLEGLRAVAVILVLLYHAGITAFGGGYVGVDVFFVLSGFFITGVIHRELARTGRVDVAAFYARRARRLVPAAAVVLLATLAGSILILPAFTLRSNAVDIVSAGLDVSNIRFGLQANDYFNATAFPSPVLHFWSLSLEEQFYFLWPAALLAAARLPLGRTERERIGVAIVCIGLASLAAGVWLTGVNQPWAFFLLPTRAWELAIGGLIAVRSRELRDALSPRAAALATAIGIGLILAATILFDDSTPFPGTAALLPVTGSALVIIGGLRDRRSVTGRALSIPPLLYLGRISYSLYLWHWPLLVFGTAALGAAVAPVIAVAAIGVAGVSQRLVEEPFRYGRFIGLATRRNLIQAVGSAAIIVVASVAAVSFWAPPRPVVAVAGEGGAGALEVDAPLPCSGCTITDLLPPLDALTTGFFDNCSLTGAADPNQCVLGAPASRDVIAVFGDSFASHWMPAFDEIGRTRDLRVLNLVRGACPPGAVTVWSEELKRVDTECDLWREQALQRIEAERPSLVVLASSDRELLAGSDGSVIDRDHSLDGPHARRWIAGLASTLRRLAATGTRIAIISQPPEFHLADLDPVPCIATHPTDFGDVCRASRDLAVDTQARAVDHRAAAGIRTLFVDPADWLCDAESCPAVIDRFVVYHDFSGHLTAPFASASAKKLAAALGLAGT